MVTLVLPIFMTQRCWLKLDREGIHVHMLRRNETYRWRASSMGRLGLADWTRLHWRKNWSGRGGNIQDCHHLRINCDDMHQT